MPIRILLLLASLCSALPVSAATVEVPNPAASPLRIAKPVFPDDSSGETEVQVDIHGRLLVDGQIDGAIITASPGHDAYIEAVKAVLPSWRYVPKADSKACEPIDSDFETSVWFDLRQQKFFVGRPKDDHVQVEPTKIPLRLVSIRTPDYPMEAQGIDGKVEVLYRFGADLTEQSAVVRFAHPQGLFEKAVLRVARHAHVEWNSSDPPHETCASELFVFCSPNASYWIAECEQKK